MWRMWISVVRNFHLKGPWVSYGQWSQTCLFFIWMSWKSLRHNEVFFSLFPWFTTPWNGSPSYFEWKDDFVGFVPFEAGLGWLYSRLCQHQMAAVAANFALFEWFCDPELLCSRGFRSVVFGGASSFRWCKWVWLRMRFLLVLHKPAWSVVLYLCFWQVTCYSIEANDYPLDWSWLLHFSQLGLMSKTMNLTFLWATATFGQTPPLCWVTWKIKGPDLTSLFQTE